MEGLEALGSFRFVENVEMLEMSDQEQQFADSQAMTSSHPQASRNPSNQKTLELNLLVLRKKQNKTTSTCQPWSFLFRINHRPFLGAKLLLKVPDIKIGHIS